MWLYFLGCAWIPSTSCGDREWYADFDGDGFGAGNPVTGCDAPSGNVAVAGDCDDGDPDAFPGAAEACDGDDQDCDGESDEGLATSTFYLDGDGDGVGGSTSVEACGPPAGYVERTDDCDDADGGVGAPSPWYSDVDRDGYGDDSTALDSCEPVADRVERGGDCDDADPDSHPGAEEECDDLDRDEDCDGKADDADDSPTGMALWYADGDGDGYGAGGAKFRCDPPSGYVGRDGDCEDEDGDVHPGAVDVCEDGIDQNCSGEDSSCFVGGKFNLDTSYSARFVGEAAGDQAGRNAVALGGDLDGDGVVDAVIGAVKNADGGSEAGAVYAVLGPYSGSTSLSAAVELAGESAGDWLGSSLAVEDLDGDGIAEVLVGAPGADDSGAAGGVVLVVGLAGSSFSELALLRAEATGDAAGSSVAGGEDLDGDGLADVVVGAPGVDAGEGEEGAVYVYSGPVAGDLDLAEAVRLSGEVSSAALGTGAVTGADLDADGVGDLVVSADMQNSVGAVYLVSGPVTASGSIGDASFGSLLGESGFDRGGQTICAGDLNTDGTDDVVVGAVGDDDSLTDAGAVYVVHLPVSGLVSLAAADSKLLGEVAYGQAGESCAVSDVDGDGRQDLAIGASADTEGGVAAGAAYVVLGPLPPSGSLADADAKLIGGYYDGAGFSMDAADVDADGKADLLIGSAFLPSGSYYGGAYLLLGSAL